MWRYGSGDDGKSSTISQPDREWKDSPIFQAIGDLDELNSFLGLAVSILKKEDISEPELEELLVSIQSNIFKIGSMINSYGSKFYEQSPKIKSEDLEELEEAIKKYSEKLEPLKSFILPGGTELASVLHISRTVCRRAERSVVRLHKEKGYPEIILRYLNRLSTLLFILARYSNKIAGVNDIEWKN